LGIQRGGLESAESLLWARYFMYTQLYFHPTRRIYDVHLKEFLSEWLPEGRFSTDVKAHLSISDNDVNAAIWKSAANDSEPTHNTAARIVNRQHFRSIYEPTPADQEKTLEPGKVIFEALVARFDGNSVRRDIYPQKGGSYDFPVYTREGRIVSSLALSRTLSQVPTFSVDRVYVAPEIREDAEKWLLQNRDMVIAANTSNIETK
jgi:uncharacterized protein